MATTETLDDLRSRILAGYTLIFLQTWEEERWEHELGTLAEEIERGLVVWSATAGPQPPANAGDGKLAGPLEFLDRLPQYPAEHLFLLKDFHPYWRQPEVIRKVRDLLPSLGSERKALLFMGPTTDVPLELRKEAIQIELPLPGLQELREELQVVLHEDARGAEAGLKIDPDDEERLLKAVLGLTAREARKALARALAGRERIDGDVFGQLVSEKKRMVEGSDLLEFQDLDEGVDDVGGLNGLKDWLGQRAEAFTERARAQGIPLPKGAMLLGVQGCGKSLTARATARLLSFPLVRLDVSSLLSADQGASERNMRDVLRLMETIAPAVLWLDEIEKGFAGTTDAGQNATMKRLFGQFLTWMEERDTPVFVVATANQIADLPPELLRRGRFDELFFVDLPNYHERVQIFAIHLRKRGWKPEKYDLEELASISEGFSGAEIEQIVISAMLNSYGQGRILSQEDLKHARQDTVPLSVTMEEKIYELREWARPRCRPATYDSRVMQMLDEEERRGALDPEAGREDREWAALAEHGQLNAAVVEYIRRYDYVTFPQLEQAFAEFLPTEGEVGLALRSDPNVVLWVGLSPEFSEVIAKLIAARRLYVHRTPLDRYQADGNALRLPPLDDLPAERLKRPAWLPVCLRDLPPEEGAGPFARVARMKLSR
ncbi:MAG TPA: AAA family ATPase [Planctomycetaceae bacterium]|nr:AAA family ATPase [Planctomycetaceae bacterium]